MFANSLRIASASWQVLRQDRELLLFPLMTLAANALILAAAAFGAIAAGATRLEPDGTTSIEMTADSWVVYGVGGLAVAGVSVFFSGALTAGAYQRMAGGDPTVSSALGHAVERLPALLGWAALTWTLGLVMRFVGSKVGWLGKVLLGGAGVLWQIAAYLAVPAIVIDDLDPVQALKRSVLLLRSTWGENLVANAGLGGIAAALLIPAAMVTAVLAGSDYSLVAALAPAAFMAWLVAVVLVVTTLNAIYQTALYLYATGEPRVAGFDEQVLAIGFRVKGADSFGG